MRRVLLWGPPILYMALIFHLSSESQPLPALTAHVWDKLLHTIEYAGLALLLARASSESEASGASSGAGPLQAWLVSFGSSSSPSAVAR